MYTNLDTTIVLLKTIGNVEQGPKFLGGTNTVVITLDNGINNLRTPQCTLRPKTHCGKIRENSWQLV